MKTLKSIYNFIISRNFVGIIEILSWIGTALFGFYISILLVAETISLVIFNVAQDWYFENIFTFLYIGLISSIVAGIINNCDINTEKKEKVQYINFKKELLG